MLRISKNYMLVIGLVAAFLLINGCENDYPESIWDPNYKSKPDPQISNVEPEENAFAGIELKIDTGYIRRRHLDLLGIGAVGAAAAAGPPFIYIIHIHIIGSQYIIPGV